MSEDIKACKDCKYGGHVGWVPCICEHDKARQFEIDYVRGTISSGKRLTCDQMRRSHVCGHKAFLFEAKEKKKSEADNAGTVN